MGQGGVTEMGNGTGVIEGGVTEMGNGTGVLREVF